MTAEALVDIGRLAKLCGMFSSDHLGERAAAAAKADALVRGAGLTWPDVLGPQLTAGGYEPKTSRCREVLSPGCILATHGDRLTGWERGFLTGLIRQPHWSTRQREVLDDIRARFL